MGLQLATAPRGATVHRIAESQSGLNTHARPHKVDILKVLQFKKRKFICICMQVHG